MSGRAEDVTQALKKWVVIIVVTLRPLCAVVCGRLLKNCPQFLIVLIGWSGPYSSGKEEVLHLPLPSTSPCIYPSWQSLTSDLTFPFGYSQGCLSDTLASKVLIFWFFAWAECEGVEPVVIVWMTIWRLPRCRSLTWEMWDDRQLFWMLFIVAEFLQKVFHS